MGRQNVKWEHIFYSAEMFPAGSVAVPKHNCGSRVGMEFLRRQALPVPVGRVGTPSELQVETVSTPLSDDQVAARLSETLSARTVRKLLTILFVLLLHNTLPQVSLLSLRMHCAPDSTFETQMPVGFNELCCRPVPFQWERNTSNS